MSVAEVIMEDTNRPSDLVLPRSRQFMKDTSSHSDLLPRSRDDWFAKRRDSLGVVAVLVAAMAFQATVSPPGGVWQDDTTEHKAGEAVMGHSEPWHFSLFLVTNTVSFFTSLTSIIFLHSGFRVKYRSMMRLLTVIMQISLYCVGITYSIAVLMVTPSANQATYWTTLRDGVLWWGAIFLAVAGGYFMRSLNWFNKSSSD